MMESVVNKFKNDLKAEVKQWWVKLLVGILYVIAAIMVMSCPIAAYISVSLIFGISVLAGGIFEVVFAIANYKTMQSWGWYLIGGVIDLFVGFMLCMYPGLSMEILPIMLALWFIFKGFTLLGYAFDLKALHSHNWAWALLFSILIIVFAILILIKPAAGAAYIIYMLGFIFLIIGLFKIILSLDLRKIYKQYKQYKEIEE